MIMTDDSARRTTRRRRFLIAGALAAATLGTAVAPASAQTADLNLTGTFTENGAGGTVDLDWDALPGTTNYWVFLNGNIVSPASSGATIDADGTGFRWSDSWSFNITGTWTVCASVCDSVTLTRPAAADPTIDVTVQRSGTRFWTATVDVHDANGDPLTNSTITGHWTNGASGSVYLALGADGINTTPRVRSTTNKRPVFVVDEVTYVGPDYMTVRYRP